MSFILDGSKLLISDFIPKKYERSNIQKILRRLFRIENELEKYIFSGVVEFSRNSKNAFQNYVLGYLPLKNFQEKF